MFTFNISTLERFSLADGNLLNLRFSTNIFMPPEGRRPNQCDRIPLALGADNR